MLPKDHLDSCAGCVFRERTVDQAKLLLNNMLSNENDWTLPEPTCGSPGLGGVRMARLYLQPDS